MVFVTGDLHGNFERFKPKYFPEQVRMTMKHWTGWNASPSRSPSSAATTKTMTRWKDTLLRSGTAARCIAFGLMCCT